MAQFLGVYVPQFGTGPNVLPQFLRGRIYLCVLFLLFVIDHSQNLVNGLKCYTDVDGKQITTCKETEGFRTCFTKYNDSIVTGRGCSTKDKVFFKECETHSYGDTVEKMCFCSFFLCNGAAISIAPNALLILALASIMSVHHLLTLLPNQDSLDRTRPLVPAREQHLDQPELQPRVCAPKCDSQWPKAGSNWRAWHRAARLELRA